jgi:hypothetical protein
MATTTLAVVDALLKEVYEPRLRDQLQSDTIALKRIERTSEGITNEVGGKYVTFPIRTRRNHGIGARAENTVLPAARSQRYAAARVSLAYLYGAAELTGQTMELADKNFQAFASAMEQEMSGLKQTLAKDMNRQTFGTNAGILATATGAGSTTTFVTTDADAQYLEVGMILDIFDTSAAGLMTGGPFEITTLVSAGGNTTVTYTGASGAATASGDTLHREGSRNLETIGLKEIIDDTGTLYNINPATEPVWKSIDNNNGGTLRALSEGIMTKVADDVRKNGGKTTVIFTTPGVRRAYAALLQQQRRYINTVEFTGGFKGLEFVTDHGEIPLISDWDCQSNRMYFVNEDELKIYREAEWAFMNRDGSNWQRKITSAGNFDAYQTMMFSYRQLGTHRRNSHALLADITEA